MGDDTGCRPRLVAAWVLAGAAIILVAAPVFATADALLYPGAICRAETQSQTADLQYTTTGAVQNSNASARAVDCPMVKDFTTDTDGFDDLEIHVYVPSSGSVTCVGYALDADGDSVDSYSQTNSTPGYQTIDLSANVASIASGFYYMRCSLSHNAYVLAIWAYENT